MPISGSMATEKAGPSAVSGFGAGCGDAIAKRPGHRERVGDSVSARPARGASTIRCCQPRRPVRIAEHAGHIYLDLANEQWRAVDVGPDGWRVMSAGALPPAARYAATACASTRAGSIRSSILQIERDAKPPILSYDSERSRCQKHCCDSSAGARDVLGRECVKKAHLAIAAKPPTFQLPPGCEPCGSSSGYCG
jgi:hypothetical protein